MSETPSDTRAGTPEDASAPPQAPPAIELVDLSYSYPDGHQALRGITLRIEAGERVAILGPNGAGKSTLCLQLNGILEATSGSVSVCGLPGSGAKNIKEVRRRVGVVFQDPDDMLFMPTVAQDVAFGPSNLNLPEDEVRARVERALATVGMEEMGDRPPHHLSFGQKKRAATAAVLSMEPEVLVLDEPSSSLDPRGRREFGELLSELDQTIIMTTHDLPYARELCERAVILDGGRIVADSPTDEILGDADLLAAHDLELPRGFVMDLHRRAPRPVKAPEEIVPLGVEHRRMRLRLRGRVLRGALEPAVGPRRGPREAEGDPRRPELPGPGLPPRRRRGSGVRAGFRQAADRRQDLRLRRTGREGGRSREGRRHAGVRPPARRARRRGRGPRVGGDPGRHAGREPLPQERLR